MKNLGKTIDRIVKVDPNLQDPLSTIKNKWKRDIRSEAKTASHWKELVNFLNSPKLMQHPLREQIRSVLVGKKDVPLLNTFEEIDKSDRVVGVIPENIADSIRCYDRKTIWFAKKRIEATMTHNVNLMAQLSREEVKIEIHIRKIWMTVKDHFGLWTNPSMFMIKKDRGALVIVERPQQPQQTGLPRIDPNMLMRLFGGELPPPPDQS